MGASDYGDYLHVSTIPDMISLGRSYQLTAKPKVAITEPVRALALKLTTGKTTERQRVRALHHWVASNIRYVQVALGNGRLVPHGAEEILHNRYGDCKDHVVLLEVLLAAVGIESSPALISSGSTYTLSSIGAHGAIDHVITYVPGLDLYLDSTDRFSPFGTLPYSVMDKPVVLTALGRMGRTPPTKLESEVVRVDVTLKMGPDGSMEGRSSATLSGVAERSSRVSRFNAKASPEEDVVKELLPQARKIVAKGFRENSVVYRGVMGGQWDGGLAIQSALKDLINGGKAYAKLPEELPPETPLNVIDDE